MDRCAVFIDAGFLLAEGGELAVGTIRRPELVCDYQQLSHDVADVVRRHSGLPLLRTYWYDGARDRVPTTDHMRVAELPDVKLRLGLVSGGRQKGVDALIYRDMTTLARERAIATAYLVSGDEDLREAVAAVQDLGVRVILLGIPFDAEQNRAPTLTREADQLLMLERDVFARSITRIEPPAAGTGSAYAAAAADVGAPSAAIPGGPRLGYREGAPDPSALLRADLAGQEFARSWTGHATAEELRELLGHQPFIPKDLDVQLIVAAEGDIGSMRDNQGVRHAVRSGFWKAVTAAVEDLDAADDLATVAAEDPPAAAAAVDPVGPAPSTPTEQV